MPAVAPATAPSPGLPSVRIICVDPKIAPRLWPHVRELLAAAFTKESDSTIEAVEADVRSGSALLWVAWDGWKVVAAATTTLLETPRHRLCLVTAAAGVHTKLWDQFMPMVERYARDEDCDTVRVAGRPGWARVLRGYRAPWVVLDKRIA